ncbi:MAG: type I DNA topoisomerase, partial [Candidatus Neomarinimicrobiota bacterium]|nr:type I DNA topoisomerase [Candidatus Neomarinimicrobiota bacterium]
MSKKPILVVESPSKARTISKYLDGDFEVLACVGHVKDLPKNKLNIDVHNNFKATLEVLPDRKQFIQELKSKAKTASKVILAMDPDREGEAIADHITQEIPQATIERIQFLEITKTAVKNALGQPRPLNTNLISAQMTRRIIDRLVGYSISPVLWGTLQKNMKFVKTALSAGRVQSAAVKIMVDRERKRARFKQANYFDLKAVLKTANSENFESNLFKLNDQNLATGKDFERETGQLKNQEVLLLTESQANALLEELKPGPWVVSDIKEKPRTSKPYPPFTTSTLQQEAGRKLRYTAKNTMRIAQRLYEAGFITYMRTDSTHLSGEALNAARSDIDRLYGKEYLPAKPIQYATKVKNAQEAHEAIRPAGRVFTSMDTVSGALGDDASKLYDLIWKRTMASQMMPARMKQTMLFISNQNALFRSRGNVILFPGYMRAYVEGKDDPRAKLADKETILPEVNVNDKIHCDDLSAVEHNTKPPARYTEASLVKALEAKGIGRPSTYASIIDTIIFREYVKNVKGALIPTFLSVAVTQLLENHFASLVNTEFTSRMEDSLDAIARGELDAFPFMKSFYFGNEKTIGL